MENLNFNPSAIFNMDTEQMMPEKDARQQSDIYKPSLGRDKVDSYASVVKFVPFIKDYTKSRLWKYAVWLTNPDTGDARWINCPTTVNEKSILGEVFFTLRDSKDAELQELQGNFKRNKLFFSPIQIISDKQHEDLEGKIKIFQYGINIDVMIDNVMKPKDGISTPNNPFDLFKGKVFSLKMQKGSTFPSYNGTGFADKTFPFSIDGQKIEEMNEANQKKIIDFLLANTPDLLKYEYRPWDDATKDFVYEAIKSSIPDSKLYNQIFSKNKFGSSNTVTVEKEVITENPKSQKAEAPKTEPTKTDSVIDDIDAYMSASSKTQETTEQVLNDKDDEIDNIIQGIGGSNTASKSSDVDLDFLNSL